jgi:hypothetical protein
MGSIVAAILIAGILSALTDWLFKGVLFRDTYNSYPEVWWPGVRDGETRGPVIWSGVLGLVMTSAVVGLCAVAGAATLGSGLGIGLLAYLAGPFAITIINAMFVKTDIWLIVSHMLSYLARLAIAGATAGLLLP